MTLDGDIHLPWIDGDAIADMVHSLLAGNEALAAPSSLQSGCRLDEPNRELVVDGQRLPTTRLEYGVMLALIRAGGHVMTRDEMLAAIWDTPFTGAEAVQHQDPLTRKAGVHRQRSTKADTPTVCPVSS